MAEKSNNLFGAVAAGLRRFVKGRRRILKRGDRFEARLPFVVTLGASRKTYRRQGEGAQAALAGITRNISETGLILLLPSVRIGEAYITDAESRLKIKLEFPNGPLEINATPVRFEQLPRRDAGCGYLLAVRIVDMDDEARRRYASYLKNGGREDVMRPREERKKTTAMGGAATNTAQSGMWDTLTPQSISKAFEQFVRE